MNLKIKPIKEVPEHVGKAAEWYRLHWGEFAPEYSMLDWEAQIHMNDDKFPITFVAIDYSDAATERLVGMASLSVRPSDRKKGIASQLLEMCIVFSETHLFERKPVEKIMVLTYATSKLYQKFGWKECGSHNFKGQQAMLLERFITN